ncbi:MAG: hypothetical protein A2X18_11725 [Bacteroidetes bacterium GWF2_40_14]|nr:MAG: hypothetical protein A2X18_11725 [Bacteroidetes bacterium GWF2_40_14]
MKLKNTIIFLLNIIITCSISAQTPRIISSIDSLDRKFTEIIRLNDTQQITKLKTELYQLSKSKEEEKVMLALKYVNKLKMSVTEDSLANVIKKRFPKGRLSRNSDVQIIYNIKDPDNKEIEYKKFVKKYPPENYTSKMTYDYIRGNIARTYADIGNPQKAMEYSNQMETKSWKSEGWAGIAPGFINRGDFENAEKLLKMAVLNYESYLNESKPNNTDVNLSDGLYCIYCSKYAEVLYKQKKYDEALKYYKIRLKSPRPFDNSEQEAYINSLKASERNLELFLFLKNLITDGQVSQTSSSLFKELYVKLNGSDSGLNELWNSIQEVLSKNLKQKLAKDLINIPAPKFSAKDIAGNTISLVDLKDKIVIIDFWATWCGPCKKSFPAMQLAVNKYKNDPNVMFLFIHTWEKEDNATETAINYLKENNFNFHLIMDLNDPVTKTNNIVTSYKVSGIPTKFIIDGNGNIRYKVTGFTGGDEAAVEEISAMIESVRK